MNLRHARKLDLAFYYSREKRNFEDNVEKLN
jgi:hypothetical protein